jgi:hypothetical protein
MKREENDLLTQTDRGTPGGELLRRYWQPVFLSAELVADKPEIVEVSLTARTGLDLAALQRDFRWASPLEAVTGILPRLIAECADPFDNMLPITGFPAVAIQPVRRKGNLTDEFLTTIAREYLARGRGYAASLAHEYFVTPRTVVGWIEKARARKILSAAPRPGATGGHLLGTVSDDAHRG